MLTGMPLTTAVPTGFIPTANAEAARAFYEGTLGLRFVADEPFALVFRLGPDPGSDLRIVRVGAKHQPVEFTVFGWEVERIEQAVDELTAKGVQFRRYPGMEQTNAESGTLPVGLKSRGFKIRIGTRFRSLNTAPNADRPLRLNANAFESVPRSRFVGKRSGPG